MTEYWIVVLVLVNSYLCYSVVERHSVRWDWQTITQSPTHNAHVWNRTATSFSEECNLSEVRASNFHDLNRSVTLSIAFM